MVSHLAAFRRPITLALIAAAVAGAGFAQVTTTGVLGRVKDPSGAVIPGVTLVLTDKATGNQKQTTSTGDGAFVFANMQQGTYTLSAKADGFQTAIVKDVEVSSGRSTEVTVDMRVGSAVETIEVAARGAQLDTVSNEVGTTISSSSIKNLPYTSRDALNFALMIPGAQSASGGSTFNGLPNASMNITLDGMNNNSQRFKSGGTSFYQFAPARLDAIDEVSVSTSGLGADAGGEGAMQIRFTTKRGTDRYRFHILEQLANEDLNANSYFNKLQGIRRSKTRTANYDGSMGGPLLPWVPHFKNKVFFFANFEDTPNYGATVRSTNVLMPEMYQGNFRYLGTDGQNHLISVLTVAGAAGFPSTIDPTIAKLMSDIRATEQSGDIVQYRPISGQPFQQTMLWNSATQTTNLYPTIRLDYQIASKVAWHGTWNQRHSNTMGNPNYPEGPFPSNNGYKIDAPVTTNTVDWTITPRVLNNFLFGTQGNMEYFYFPSDVHQWSRYGDIKYTTTVPVTNNPPLQTPLIPVLTPWKRNNPVYQFSDTLTWVRNRHTITMGGSLLRTTFYENSFPGDSAGVPTYSFGVSTSDTVGTAIQNAMPALNLNGTDATYAKALYAQLTGRLTGISASIAVDDKTHQYRKYVPLSQKFAFTTGGLFLQDSFRLHRHFTLNYGLRWQFDGVAHNTNGIDSSPTGSPFGPSADPFQPGVFGGTADPQYDIRGLPYKRDFVNPAPNLGFNWNPSADGGILGKLLGGNKTVIGASYAVTYYDEGLNAISNVQSAGPGATQSLSASAAITAKPGAYNLTTPLPAISTTPVSFSFPIPLSSYPFLNSRTPQYINGNLRAPYAQNWNFRIQREIARGTVVEVRYIGTKSTHMWHYQNVNETNVLENGFLQEFQRAQNNLAINTANGRTGFANNGLAGQSALPIFETAFGANGNQAALATTQGFTNATFIQNLQQGQIASLAQTLASTSTATYYCRLVGSNFAPCIGQGYAAATKYPSNFFRANPFGNSVMYQDSNGDNNYNALQVELRKSPGHGLMINTWWVWSHTLGNNSNSSDQTAGYTWSTIRDARLSYGPTPFDHRHNFLLYLTYDLPMGKGKALDFNHRVLNGILGNWTLSETSQVTTAGPSPLSGGRLTFNDFADGGVTLGNGITIDNLVSRMGSMTTGNFVASCVCFKTNVSDLVLANGAVDPKYLAPSQTAGVMGSPLYYRGRPSYTFNLALKKEFKLKERYTLGFWATASNFLNHPFFGLGNLSATSTNFGNITSASGTRTMLLRGYLDF